MRKFYKIKALVLCIMLLVASGSSLFGQINLTATAGTPVGSFTTISDAFAAINAGTHQGNIVISVDGNTIEPAAPVALSANGVLTTLFTSVVIKPSVVATISGAPDAGNAVINFSGSDNVIVDGSITVGGTTRDLTISNTNVGTILNTATIRMIGQTVAGTGLDVNNFTIKNNIIIGSTPGNNGTSGSTATTVFGIYAGSNSATTMSAFTAGANYDNITIENNEIKRAYYGISIYGGTSPNQNDNLIIRNNVIGSSVLTDQIGFKGINAYQTLIGLIETNEVFDIKGTSSISRVGIEVGGTASDLVTVSRNHVVGINTEATSGAYGINLAGGTNHLVVNNVLTDIKTTNNNTVSQLSNAIGIRISSGTGHGIYYNSVNLFGAYAAGTVASYSSAFAVTTTTATGLVIRNNIFSNKITSASTGNQEHMAVWFATSYNFLNATLNNNFYGIPSDGVHYVGKIGLTSTTNLFVDLGQWQGVSQVNNATNDVDSEPVSNTVAPFTSDLDLTIPGGTITTIESSGFEIAALGLPNIDFLTLNRPVAPGTAPDIGAYEFAGSLITCPQPSSLTATNVTSISADLGWTEGGTATLWNLEYGPNGFVQGTGTSANGLTVTTYPISGLSSFTSYQFYVQADCGGGDLSSWSGPFTFTTACGVYVAPWVDNVEAHSPTVSLTTSNCWSTTGTGYDWNIDGVGSTPSTGTGPTGANSGVNYFYVEASSGTAGVSTTELITPLVDVSVLTIPMLEFYYHMFGGQIGDLFVDAWDGTTWNQVDLISGQQQTAQTDPWIKRTIYLLGYTDTTQIRFRAVSGGTFEGDISIDDISISESPSCPEPMSLTVNNADLNSAIIAWTEISGATQWTIEYGPVGFTPGTGISAITNTNPDTLTGLTQNTFYDVYIRSICSPGDTSLLSSPISFNTYDQGLYMDWDNECPAANFIDISGTGIDLNLTDDSEAGVTLPFSLLYQGTLIDDITVGNNGGIMLGTLTGNVGYGGNMNTLANSIWLWGDDLDDETGNVYHQTIGTAPNRTFIVQWDNICNFSGSLSAPTVTFQLQIDEATQEFYFVYTDVEFGAPNQTDDFGANADLGIAGPNQDIIVSSNNSTYLQSNSCAHFYYIDCPKPVAFTISYITPDEAAFTWTAGLAGETNWTIIYGPAGFDPLTSGTTITSTSAAATLPGLTQNTQYDVYVYADCDVTLQSNGLMGTFLTAPYCSNPSGMVNSTAVDSIFTSWSWTESSPTYPSTGFNLQYGMNGFQLYSGSTIPVNNDFTDTIADATLLAGGVYQIYVQAVCGTDTSQFVGPFNVTMPLTNDSVCGAEMLMANGTVYTFNNTGATVQPSETIIAPPATGAQTTTGWINSTLNNTVWFTFVAPASGNVRVRNTAINYAGQSAVYSSIGCSDFNNFTLIAANDNEIGGTSVAANYTICGLIPGNTYYLLHDGNSATTGNYSISILPINLNAGSFVDVLDVCTGDTVNLFDGITSNDNGGVWTAELISAGTGLTDSLFATQGLAYQVFNFEYRMTDGCAYDSIIAQVQIFAPSSAGNDGTIIVCRNEPFDLLSGLSGNVDLGGTWYDPSNAAIPSSSITSGNLPGQYNYDYITGNGVCANDTANVLVDVLGCNWLDVQEMYFGEMSLLPNPTNGLVYISNTGSTEVFNYEITDLDGRVIATKKSAINGSSVTEINLNGKVTGMYLIRVFNDNAEKVFRVILQ